MVFENTRKFIEDKNLLSKEILNDAEKEASEFKSNLADYVVNKGLLTTSQVYNSIAEGLGVEFFDIASPSFEIRENVTEFITEQLALKYTLFPLEFHKSTIVVVISDPTSEKVKTELKEEFGFDVELKLGVEKDIQNVITYYYKERRAQSKLSKFNDLLSMFDDVSDDVSRNNIIIANENEESAPVIELLNLIIEQAASKEASDIHIEPTENDAKIRLRVDGSLREMTSLHKRIANHLVARIKVLCSLKLAEKRRPQDGQLIYISSYYNIEMRVSIIPTIHGESVVMRLVNKNSTTRTIDTLGLSEYDKKVFMKLINNKHGLVLVTGPTGSGKTTTLYTALRQINSPDKNIITVEDPVETQIDGIKQIQVNHEIDLDFAVTLRSILRHDPDVIFVGEIRDNETAEIAIRASITGHLVLSTLHTNDAISAIHRLKDMGIEKYLLSSALVGSIAQRLVRKVCKNCSFDRKITKEEAEILDIEEGTTIVDSKGCLLCGNTGYSGRTAIYESILINRDLRYAIDRDSDLETLTNIAKKQGMRTLQDNCRDLVINKITKVDEAIQVVFSKG